MSRYANEANINNMAPSCAYSTLGNMNKNRTMGLPHSRRMNATAQAHMAQGVQVIPDFGSIGYNGLSLPEPSCSGYANIMTAYGANSGNCVTATMRRPCGN